MSFDCAISKKNGLSSFWLKIAAVAGMTCNHVANVFATHLPSALSCSLYLLGGVTFPIMAFLLIQGFLHTSNVRRYALRLLVFACLSQVPYSLLWGATPNVLFTLLASLLMLIALDRLESPALKTLVVMVVVAGTFAFDWGSIGPMMVLVGFTERTERRRRWMPLVLASLILASTGAIVLFSGLATPGAIVASATASNQILAAGPVVASIAEILFALAVVALAGPLLSSYNGKRGRPAKWLFYVYYPAHLSALWVLSLIL